MLPNGNSIKAFGASGARFCTGPTFACEPANTETLARATIKVTQCTFIRFIFNSVLR